MNQESPNSGTLFIRHIPCTLKREFKAWCDKQGITMTAAIQAYMKEKAWTSDLPAPAKE